MNGSGRPDTSASEEGGRRSSGRNLPVAIGSGVLLAVVFVGTVLWHPLAFGAVVAVLVAIGIVETGRVLRETGVPVAVPVVLVAGAVMLVGAYLRGATGQIAGAAVLFVGAVLWELVDPRRKGAFERLGHTLLLGMWVPFLATYAVLLAVRPDHGWLAVIATAGAAIVSDIGAYAVGTAFGRHKLAPTVSPGKTWEGVLGGLGVVSVVATVVLPLLGDLFSWWSALVFGFVVGAAGVVGDLVESMLKRDLGVKDFGGVIPGHGGVLDRVDGVLIALPVGYYLLALTSG